MFFINDDIRVVLVPNEPLSGSTVLVKYKKPHTTIELSVAPTSVDLENNKVVYDLPKAANNSAGVWKFWLHITNSELKEATSTELEIKIEKH